MSLGIIPLAWKRARRCSSRARGDTEANQTSYQKALRNAEQVAAARRRIDWRYYTPLTPGEYLEARDPTEAEAWADIEDEARRRHHELSREPLDEAVTENITTVRELWAEVLEEMFEAAACRRR